MYLKHLFLVVIFLISNSLFANTITPPDNYIPITTSSNIKLANIALDDANNNVVVADVLLIQTALPWGSDANTKILDQLGYTYKSVDMSEVPSTDINNYQVVLIVNDQNQAFYDNYATNYLKFESYVKNGGTLVFFAVDHGWAGGDNQANLPGGVEVGDRFENYNVITKSDHPIITEELTQALQIPYRDGALIDSDLSGSYASHNYFPAPPDGATILVKEKDNGQATLMIYSLGKGHVIASGLTWEFTYARYTGKNETYGFGRALPDLFKYAFTLAGGLEKQDVSVFLYPEDQYEEKGREILWKHPGDIFDVVAQIDNNSGETQSDVSLTFKVDASVIDSDQPVYVYRRNQPESVDRGLNLIKLVEGQDYTVDLTGKVTLTNLTIIEGDNTEYVLRFRITEVKQSRSIDVEATISSDVINSTSKLSDGGTVALTGDGRIILTNRTLFYKYFAKDKSRYSYGKIKQLWKTLYKVAANEHAVIAYVDKYDQDYDTDTSVNPTISWLTDRGNIAYDEDFQTSEEEKDINLVATKIASLERDLLSKSGSGHNRFVALLGGDEIIPFYRAFDGTKTVLNTCRNEKARYTIVCDDKSWNVAGEVTLNDTLNGYLLTDGIYRTSNRVLVSNGDWKLGNFANDGVNVGRIVGGVPSLDRIAAALDTYIRLLQSSSGIVGNSDNVIKLENARRDGELTKYQTMMEGANYTVIQEIDEVSLDGDVAADCLKDLKDDQVPRWVFCREFFPETDAANWVDLQKVFEGNADNFKDFALLRFMTHGTTESIVASENVKPTSYHDYSTFADLSSLNDDKVKAALKDVKPLFIGDACLIAQIENKHSNGWINHLLGQYVGGVFASTSVTISDVSDIDISGYNDIISENLLSNFTTGESLTRAMSGFASNLERIQMNLYGLPWARLAIRSQNNQRAAKFSKVAAQNKELLIQADANNVLNKKILVDTSNYRLVKHNQYDLVVISGYKLNSTGSKMPALPKKQLKVSIPANASAINVSFNDDGFKALGQLNIPGIIPPPLTVGQDDQESGFIDLAGVSGVYPDSALSYNVIDLGTSKQVNISFLPVKYNIDTKDTSIITKGEIIIQYTTPDKGVVKSLVTDKYVYKSAEAGIVTASIENTSAADATFTVNISVLDLAGAETSHETKSITVPVGEVVEQQVDFTAPVAGGHYRVKISVSDGGAANIGESITDIRVVAKEITSIVIPESVVKKEITTIVVELNNYTASSYNGVLKLDIYSINGGLIASLPSKNLTLSGNSKVIESYPWTASESFSSGDHYVKGIFSISNDETLIASSDEFILQGDEDISLSSGWNLISFPVTPDVSNIEQAIMAISGSIRSIWSFSNDQWKSYDPGNPNFSTLTDFESGVGYWFDMKSADILGVKGVTANTSVNLVAGWNLIGYPVPTTKTVSEVMASIDGKFDSVWSYENGQWKSYDASQPNFSSLANFKPKYGYWIKVKENISLSF